MIPILNIILKYRNILLWLLLQLISILFIVNYNHHQKQRTEDSLLQFNGWLEKGRANVAYYFNLSDKNAALQNENIQLRNELFSTRTKLDILDAALQKDTTFMIDTTGMMRQSYKYIPCRVLNSTTNKNYNYIVLNRGERDGIKVGMGVVSPKGVAGRVIRVSKDYALAHSLLNLDFKLSVKTTHTGNVGQYEWDGSDSRYGILSYIPQEVDLRRGDTIVSSGFSSVFPEGFILGVVEDNKTTSSGFYRAKLLLSTDFYTLNDVYVVDAAHKPVIDSLMTNLPTE